MIAHVLAALVLLIGNAAVAQTPQDDAKRENLKRLLEQKFGPATRQQPAQPQQPQTRSLRAPPAAGAPTTLGPVIKRDELIIIDKDGKVAPPAATGQPAPQRKSDLFRNAISAARQKAVPAGAEDLTSTLTARITTETTTRSLRTAQAPARPVADEQMMVKRNSFIIQLKPDTTAGQIDALLDKYRLRVTKHVATLGVLYVEPMDPPAQAPGGTVRGAPAPQKKDLKTILEPKIITDLRREPAVDAAFVNSSIGPKAVARSPGMKIEDGSNTYTWSWQHDAGADGNWGLKRLRMPAVWTIIDRTRETATVKPLTTVSFLDNGFGKHTQLNYNLVRGGLQPIPPVPDCGRSHGTHVAGIVGASFGTTTGIDGIVPGARLDAIPISRELLAESAADGTDLAQQHVAFFMDALADLAEYMDEQPMQPNERRVVNVSLAYNWSWVARLTRTNPAENRVIRDQIRQHAKVVQTMVNRVGSNVLFVVAAGNDSEGLADPMKAEFATPFAFAALVESANFKPSQNIIVVEAKDRDGNRALFSNIGGHVAAPGVDIMSTIASTQRPYGVCSGTSQAAPHVTALATILFDLDPARKPAEVIDIIKKTAIPSADGRSAPHVDFFEAVLKVADKKALQHLADLNKDGKVDAADLAIFKDHTVALETARFGAAPITIDLNGDGRVDEYERCWPAIDLNGSGRASFMPDDKRLVGGVMRSDLDVMELAWTDPQTDFKTALRDSELGSLIDSWRATALVAAAPRLDLKVPCN
jgi:Subtilase family/Dockerin type I domain